MAEQSRAVALMMAVVALAVVGAVTEKVGPQPITHVATTDITDMMNPGPDRRMELPGFDPEFVDFPHYIIRITERSLGTTELILGNCDPHEIYPTFWA